MTKQQILLISAASLFITVVLLFNFGLFSSDKYQENQKEDFLEPSAVEKIYSDFNDGDIDPDTFVMQLAYSLFEPGRLDDEYKSNKKKDVYMAPHVLEEAERYWDELSENTKNYIAEKTLLTDLDFGTDVSNKTAGRNIPGVLKAYASSASVTTLNKAILSSDENFIIFYTDTGESKISDAAAKKIADRMVNYVSSIKREFGYDFKYEVINSYGRLAVGEQNVHRKMSSVLKANSIDPEYLYTTLPVYIYFSGNEITSESMAYYIAGIDGIYGDFLLRLLPDLTQTVPSLPYIVIKPSSVSEKEDLELILAHELFHHYQAYICGNGKYKHPESGLFTRETTANLVAATVVEVGTKDTVLHKQLGAYLERTNERVDNPNILNHGYNSFTFLKVYSDIVPNGKNIVMESIKVEGRSVLDHLNEKAGPKMMEVMETLAEKNLTNDYDHGAMKGKYKPAQNGLKLGQGEYSIQEYTQGLTISYFYLDMREYKSENEINIYTSDAKKELARNASVLVLGSKKNYQLLDKFNLAEDIVLNTSDYSGYDEIALAFVAGDIPSSVYYTIQIAEKGLAEIPEETDPLTDSSGDIPDMLKAIKSIPDLIEAFKEMVEAFWELVALLMYLLEFLLYLFS
jgi:hypothetical protein